MRCRCKFLERLERNFSADDSKRQVYMDYGATTPPDKEVIAVYEKTLMNLWGNPSSAHLPGLKSAGTGDENVAELKKLLGSKFSRLDFCSTASEALELGITRLMGKYSCFVTTASEHPILLRIAERYGSSSKIIPVKSDGSINQEILSKELTANPDSLLVFSPANHETGAVQDLPAIYRISRKTGTGILLDGAVAEARMHPEKWLPYSDGVVLSAHKIYGIKGGAVLARNKYLICGDEPDLVPGTPDIPMQAALTAAVRKHFSTLDDELSRIRILESDGLRILEGGSFDFVLESPSCKVPGVINISIPWVRDMEDLFFELNKNLIFLGRFAACGGTVTGESSVLSAMGVPQERSRKSLRITLGRGSRLGDFWALRKFFEIYDRHI